MTIDVHIPEIAEGVTQGTVVGLLVEPGARVEADQSLIELETDKAVVAIPAPAAGVLRELLVKEGETVAVGAVIARIDSETAAAEAQAAPAEVEQPAGEPPVTVEPEPAPDSVAEPEPDMPPMVRSEEPAPYDSGQKPIDLTAVRRGDRVAPASPTVRRLARDLGVDIYQVQGSGPGGRISADDVRAFVRATMQRVTGGGVTPAEFPGLHAQRPLPDFSRFGTVRREKLSRIRQVTADTMSYSWATVPMVTQYDRADITALEEFRQQHNGKLPAGEQLTLTTILAKVCAAALRRYPHFNSSLDLAAGELVLKEYVHIGIAVDTEHGLLVPVLRDVERKGLLELARETNLLAQKTRERKVSPEELEGGCFTISNLGGIGGTSFTPLVYPPQVAILGVARAATEPVWNGTDFEPRLILPLALSYDHRVIDGADGARFLRFVCAALEQPLNLLL
ncbi:MAG: 2-oxo acid dehydrogenase subunit E2 [Geothermobacteraceae bacterium]